MAVGELWLVSQERRNGSPTSDGRLPPAVLPQPERPLRHAHPRRRFSGRESELKPPRAQLRRQRIALLAAVFGFSRPQCHPNARYQKGYGTQANSYCRNERFRECGSVVGVGKSSRVPDRWGARAPLDVRIDLQFPARRPMLGIRPVAVRQEQQKDSER